MTPLQTSSRLQVPGATIHDLAMALARNLGTEPVVFPDDHMGCETDAESFAAVLDQAIGGE